MSTLFISAPGDLNPKEINPSTNGIADVDIQIGRSKIIAAAVRSERERSSDGGNATYKKSFKAIIVGAGISGLRAASVLQRHGVHVTILEGRPDRIGGRIYTKRQQGKAVQDIGAAWMHETSQNKLVQLIPKLNIEYYYDDGTPLYYTRDGRAGSQFKAKKVADEFADYCEWFYTEHPDAPDRSVKDFVEDFVNTHPLITSDERLWAPQATREVELWIGTSLEEASSKHLSYFVTERNLYMKGGYDKIVDWTARPLLQDLETIRLGELVKDIQWDVHDESVVVHSVNGGQSNSYTADAVIVTVPLGVLRRNMITFDPPLPLAIQTGIKSFSYGALGKVFVEFSEVFWSKDNDQFVYYPSPLPAADTPLDESSILSYATVTSNLWIMSGTKGLCIQISEPLTQRVESTTSPSALYAFFEPLFRLLRTEPYKVLPPLVSIETTHWTQDPLAGFGTYSVEKSGDEPAKLIEALNEHRRSRLQFAGEHCTVVGNGCVHGAFETGEVAARNLLDTFGVPFDGKETSTRSVSP